MMNFFGSGDSFPLETIISSFFFSFTFLYLKNLQKISKLHLFNFLCPCDWIQETAIWILEVWLTFTEHHSFVHMSYRLLEWITNLSTTYDIRITSCLKTKLWKKNRSKYASKNTGDKVWCWVENHIPSTQAKQFPNGSIQKTHTAMEQDITVHVNITFCVWHARCIFHYTKHLKIHRKIGTLPLYGALGMLRMCINFSPFPLRMHRNLVVVQNPLNV